MKTKYIVALLLLSGLGYLSYQKLTESNESVEVIQDSTYVDSLITDSTFMDTTNELSPDTIK